MPVKIIVSYNFTRDPGNPGFCETGMAYILGLELLGYEVYLIDEVSPSQRFDARHSPVRFAEWDGRQRFDALTKSYGIWPRACLIDNETRATHGLKFEEIVNVARDAELLLVISGRVRTPEVLESVRRAAYVDINPAKTQVYASEHAVDYGFDRYDRFFTVGLNIGSPDCELPSCGVTWHGILQPVVLDLWPARIDDRCRRFTTISTWAGRHTFTFKGEYSGEKSDQWLEFIDLPRRTRQELEIALKLHAGSGASRRGEAEGEKFRMHGWRLHDPRELRTLDDYRDYLAASRAEFSIASNRYVKFRTGWFSDRSARYLASGKPVLVQSTGFEDHLPTGRGLLAFRSLEEAAAGIEEINRDYLTHCRAARMIAEEHFDSNQVLSKLLQQVGLSQVRL